MGVSILIYRQGHRPEEIKGVDRMLQISHLYKNYGKFQAVKNLSLHIPQGDLFGFVGPNGAGKTTTIRMVCGLMLPTAGEISINGVDALAHQKEIKKKSARWMPWH